MAYIELIDRDPEVKGTEDKVRAAEQAAAEGEAAPPPAEEA
jgi:hypothetical protein